MIELNDKRIHILWYCFTELPNKK